MKKKKSPKTQRPKTPPTGGGKGIDWAVAELIIRNSHTFSSDDKGVDEDDPHTRNLFLAATGRK